jgi:hypothetical protein
MKRVIQTLIVMLFRIRSSFFVPKRCAMTIPKPEVTPIPNPWIKKSTPPTDPMAASPSTPNVLPMMIVSAKLYSCWNIFPISIGTANSKSSFAGLPAVISFVILHLHLMILGLADLYYTRDVRTN